jgi:hypothetical protein
MMLISMGESEAADTGSGSILGKSADRFFDTLRLLTAVPVHYSTNMPKLLKNLYNEPLKKARGRFMGGRIDEKAFLRKDNRIKDR